VTDRSTTLSASRLRNIALVALPLAVLLLCLLVWVTAVSRSGFWADDFLNLTHFSRSLGDLSNDHINDGHYIINVFWAVGTQAFGDGSVIPFLLLNTFVFAGGLILWLWAGIPTRWRTLDSLWIAGLFIATGAWLPTSLWSTNITHSGGFLALGAGLATHEQCLRARTARDALLWSAACGAAWTAAVISNIIYIGLVVVAAYCAVHQVLKLRQFDYTFRSGLPVGIWNLALPVIFFATVAYPATTASPTYAHNGYGYFHKNFEFYKAILAPTTLLVITYVVTLVLAGVGAVVGIRRTNWFPATLLAAAVAMAVPALIQSQQREIHYLAMPLLLLFSAVAVGARPALVGHTRALAQARGALLLAAAVALVLLYRQGADTRAYFVQTPYGGALARFRTQAASLAPEGSVVCVRLNLDAPHQAMFIAEMSGTDGFVVPPINASGAYLVGGNQPCPVQATSANIVVGLNKRGDFVATG
jgi:hypothetical protein